MRPPFTRLLSFALLLLGAGAVVRATDTVSVAAAANFTYALDALGAAFKRTAPGVSLTVTIGASGSLFAQVKNGAPFEVFLSADTEFPSQLVAANLADAASLRAFATGRLVLWTTHRDLDISDLARVLRAPAVKKIAIAQPSAAPYGRAAQATLEKIGAWNAVRPRVVFGESISQTAQFVETGNAELGFVALSLVLSPRLKNRGRWREIPPELYASISLDHAAVLTNAGTKNPAAKRFLDFLQSAPAKKILRDFGYAVPE